jgi:chromosome segregation ATPase
MGKPKFSPQSSNRKKQGPPDPTENVFFRNPFLQHSYIMKQVWIAGLMALFLMGCNAQEMEQLKLENEQLKAALGESNAFATETNGKLAQIDVLLDSIESAEKSLALTLTEGTNYGGYSERLRNVQQFIENSKREIETLEKQLAKSKTNNGVFLSQIERLKKTVEEREARVVELSQQVEQYKEQNTSLIKTVDLQEQELLAREARINEKKKEMAMLETRLQALLAEAKKAEADSYFAQAEMQEQLAQKTKLAPKKKQEHLQQAYDLYKKSFESGRLEASDKMKALEGELK